MPEQAKGREAAIDYMKLLSCVGVIVIHCSGYGLPYYAPFTPSWTICAFWDGIARFAVPVFFMCTGALMLTPERELSLRRIWKDYFLRVLLLLFFWAFAYKMFMALGSYVIYGSFPTQNVLKASILEVLGFNHHLHLYYLQILLLIYAALPVLRVFTRAAARRELWYCIALWAALGIALPLLRLFPPVSLLGGLWEHYPINMAWSALGYALLGYAMQTREVSRREWRGFLLMFLLGFIITLGGTMLATYITGENYLEFMEGMSPGPALMAAGVFGLTRSLCVGKTGSPRLRVLVRASFCVYLIHHFFVMILRQLGLDLTVFHPAYIIPIDTVVVLLCSLIGWFILSRIPFVRKHLI